MKKIKMARGTTLTFSEGCNKYLYSFHLLIETKRDVKAVSVSSPPSLPPLSEKCGRTYLSAYTDGIYKLLIDSFASLDLTDILGSGGCHAGNGIVVAIAVAVVNTHNSPNDVLSLTTCEHTVAFF